MKKILFLPAALVLCTLIFSSCEKNRPEDGVTSYTLINKINYAFLGYSIDVTIYEYDKEDNRIDSNIVKQPKYKEEYTFYPAENTDHLKMKLTSSENTVRWANKYFYLEAGKNIVLSAGLDLLTDEDSYCFNEPIL